MQGISIKSTPCTLIDQNKRRCHEDAESAFAIRASFMRKLNKDDSSRRSLRNVSSFLAATACR